MAIAAASAVVRAGLESVVRASGAFEFTGAYSLADLESRMDEISADVLLLELPRFEEDWGADPLPIVLLTQAPDITALRGSIRAVLSADATAAEIAAAIASAAVGLLTIQPSALDARPAGTAMEEPLSPREQEVLVLLAEGLSNKILAYRLGISEHTVKFHITSIMGKLRATSRTDAVMQGIRRGLILI